MSEDDRAAKAARAKALLNKKRQQKKAAGTPVASTTDLPSSPVISPPVSRSFTPQPSEPLAPSETSISPPISTENGARDPGSLFGDAKDGSDDWISTLTKVESAPLPTTTAMTPASTRDSLRSAPQLSERADDGVLQALKTEAYVLRSERDSLRSERDSLRSQIDRLSELESELRTAESKLVAEQERSKALEAQVQQLQSDKEAAASNQQSQQQTISLLVSEKAALTSELERLGGVEQNALETASLLEEQKAHSQELDERARQLAFEVREASERIQEYQAKEKELSERCRDQERELQLANGTIKQLQSESAKHQQRVRDLEEQIQSDDRVETLEESLQNTRDRADELELKLTKLKQAHQTLKTDNDKLANQLDASRDAEAKSSVKIAELEAQQGGSQSLITAMAVEKEVLSKEKADLEIQIKSSQDKIVDIQQKFDLVTAELAAASRQLEIAQTESRNAIRRAKDAERTQADLQTEGTNLMRSLDEMRPKIVELTGIKLELGEKIESLERVLKSRDATISELESNLDELREQRDEATKKLHSTLVMQDQAQVQSQESLSELQKAYSELQAELESALASVRSLESDRTNHHQEATRRLEEISQLTKASRAQADELASLRKELAERSAEQDENQDLLDRIQNELESLRNELALRDEEIERLRQNSSPTTKSEDPHSLDHEILDSLRQQHALELSAAQSSIRALEESVFEAQSRAHALQKQVVALEEQLAAQARTPSRNSGHRPFSPVNGVPSRPSSRSGFAHRPTSSLAAPPISRSVFEQHLSPETLHKRKVSLSMLKARIESESAATTHSSPPSRSMSPAPVALPTIKEPHVHINSQVPHRSHFLDESHVFWCHSCSGDLVVL